MDNIPIIDLTPDSVEYIRVEQFDVMIQELEDIKVDNEKLKKDVEALKAKDLAEKAKKGKYYCS